LTWTIGQIVFFLPALSRKIKNDGFSVLFFMGLRTFLLSKGESSTKTNSQNVGTLSFFFRYSKIAIFFSKPKMSSLTINPIFFSRGCIEASKTKKIMKKDIEKKKHQEIRFWSVGVSLFENFCGKIIYKLFIKIKKKKNERYFDFFSNRWFEWLHKSDHNQKCILQGYLNVNRISLQNLF